MEGLSEEMNLMKVDLNADLGESFGPYQIGNDPDMLDIVTSANVACGFQGGDPEIMADTVDLCIEKKVAIGAHPGFQDLKGFGRRRIEISSKELRYLTLYQIGALKSIILAKGGLLNHVKLHGALNNIACEDLEISSVFTQAIKDFDMLLPIFVVAGTKLQEAATLLDQPFKCEVFADRSYTDHGQLVSRKMSGALIHDPMIAADNVLKMLEEKALTSIIGKKIPVSVDTICVHGDNPAAIKLAETVRTKLEKAGIEVGSS